MREHYRRGWKMQEWQMQEQTAEAENAGVEIAGATKYGMPSEENNLKYQTKYGCRGFHAYLTSTYCQTQLTSVSPTIDSVSDVSSYPRSGHQTRQETR